MKAYKIEFESTNKYDEYRTENGSVVGTGTSLGEARESAYDLLIRFKDVTILYEYELKRLRE